MSHELDTLSEEVSRLSNAELDCSLKCLVKADRALTAKLLVHLGEVEARKLYVERGYSSLFCYCRDALGLSEDEACLRKEVAKVGRRFPLVLERLGAGDLHLSGIRLLAPHLTEDNHVLLLDRARRMTKRQIEVLVAELAPRPDVPARMRRLPEAHGTIQSSLAAPTTALKASSALQAVGTALTSTAVGAAISVPPSASTSNSTGAQSVASGVAAAAQSGANLIKGNEHERRGDASVHRIDQSGPSASPTFALESPRARGSCTPLSPGRFSLELTLGQEGHDNLEQLVELFRHQNPRGDLARIVERALSELLERTMKQRFGQTCAPERRVGREKAKSKLANGTGETGAKNDGNMLQPKAGSTPKPIQSGGKLGRRASAAEGGATRDVPANAKAQSNASLGGTRYIRRKVRREVYVRDAGQCTFVSPDGRRCTARGFLEVHHHDTTYARGGEASVDNLRLACRVHNFFLAERDYGRTFMQSKLREAAARKNASRALGPERDEA